MKRFLISSFVVFLVVAFFSFFVSAIGDFQCGDSQTILRLSGITNAHGQINSIAEEYPVEICYNKFFDGNFDGSDPHDSDGENNVVLLSSDDNAHAEAPDGGGYPVVVSYGDLECRITTGNCDGALGEAPLFSLSDIENAHFALRNIYSQHLCCSSTANPPICNYNDVCEAEIGETWYNCVDCESEIICGNNILETGEECEVGPDGEFGTDDDQLLGKKCSDFADYVSGKLTCSPTTCTYNKNSCITGTGEKGVCIESNVFDFVDDDGIRHLVTYCDDYNNINTNDYSLVDREDACKSDCRDVSNNHLKDYGHQGNCAWNLDRAADDRCQFKSTFKGPNNDFCEIVYEYGSCDAESESRALTYQYINEAGNIDPLGCNSDCGALESCERTVKCARAIQLPFYTNGSFIISLMVIILIYLAMFVKKRKS